MFAIITSTLLLSSIFIDIVSSVGIRKSSFTLTDDEKNEILEALYLMKTTPSIYNSSFTAYDWFVYQHKLANDPFTTYGHATWSFLPWHRIFLHLFEVEMRRVANDDTLNLPYWDAANTEATNDLLTDTTFLGGDGDAEWPHWVSNQSGLNCHDFPININGAPLTNEDNYCLTRRIGVGILVNNGTYQIAKIGTTEEWTDVVETWRPYDVAPWNSANETYTLQKHLHSFRSLLEGCWKWTTNDNKSSDDLIATVGLGLCAGLHGGLHLHVGGHLASFGSPNDPLFFMVHNWIDLLWAKYQRRWADNPESKIPEQFLDIDITKGGFPSSDWKTSRDVIDIETQMDYTYDIFVQDDMMTTTDMATTGEVDGASIHSVFITFVFVTVFIYISL